MVSFVHVMFNERLRAVESFVSAQKFPQGSETMELLGGMKDVLPDEANH